jgi:hypothetical protein
MKLSTFSFFIKAEGLDLSAAGSHEPARLK